ncbi:hypothetical protein [Dehalogenimonas alkenigignens]|uniref:Bacterial PH domain n=1 Tax=Dehalogenimonas alkenigignens TaxID=1217799 RepID=A0A0W0GJN3_9CHLR|nr:hypothetical protein [Dehalogenimonas alkenigignens]KTB48778.1 hypothetical protein DEALK_16250 [Dehalogenimonas alkenigignens]
MSTLLGRILIQIRMLVYLLRLLFGGYKEGNSRFSYHRRSAAMPLTFMMVFIAPAGVFLTALILPWPILTWVLAVILGYALVYTAGLYSSMIALPHELTQDRLILRYGAIASGEIPCSFIKSAAISREWLGQTGDGLKFGLAENTACFSIGSATSMKLELSQPVEMTLWGQTTQRVTFIYFHADEPDRMIAEINKRCPVAESSVAGF